MFSRDYYLQGMIVTTDLSDSKASLRLSAVKEYYNDSEVNKGFLIEFTDEEIETGAKLLGVEKNAEELSKVEKS